MMWVRSIVVGVVNQANPNGVRGHDITGCYGSDKCEPAIMMLVRVSFTRCQCTYHAFQFFLELLYYSKRPSESGREKVPVETLQQLRSADQDLRSEEGSVFEAAASSFSSLVEEMEHRLVTEVVDKAKLTSRKYRAERFVA